MENLNNISQLLNEVKTISNSYDRVAEATGENFNIFSILQVESDEVRTHSRFIAELLNPNGSHAQKDKFLKIFFKQFADDFEIDSAKCKVFVEYYIGGVTIDSGGRLDILIKEENSKRVLMIENKINAGEQQNQLLRYYKQFPEGKLFFLTLNGGESAEKSSENITYKSISYEKDIVNWLEECKKEAVAVPILRETISQYINLIKKLTNQNLNKTMNKDIVERVLRDQDSFLSYKTLIGVHNEIFKEIIAVDFFKVLEEIAANNDLVLDIDKGFINGQRYSGFRFSCDLLSDKNLTIRFDYEDGNFKNPLLGFEYLNKPNPNEFKHQQIVAKFKNVFDGFFETDNFCCFIWYKEMANLNNLNVLYNLRYGSLKEDIIDKISKMLDIIKVA